MTHTNASEKRGRDQQKILAAEGVNLANVVIGHSGDTTDIDYLRELMDVGSTIGSDRFGYYIPGHASMEERVDMIARLCDLGYADRIVLGHDAHCYADWDNAIVGQPHLRQWRFTHISDDVLPQLAKRGVSPEHVRTMLVDNPRRLLTPVAPYLLNPAGYANHVEKAETMISGICKAFGIATAFEVDNFDCRLDSWPS